MYDDLHHLCVLVSHDDIAHNCGVTDEGKIQGQRGRGQYLLKEMRESPLSKGGDGDEEDHCGHQKEEREGTSIPLQSTLQSFIVEGDEADEEDLVTMR